MKQNSRNPTWCNCSKTSWTIGFKHKSPFFALAKTGSISFGCSFVTDRSLVPSPAAGITAFLSTESFSSKIKLFCSVYNFLESGVFLENLSLLSATENGSRFEKAVVICLHSGNGLCGIMHCCDLCVSRDPHNRDRH